MVSQKKEIGGPDLKANSQPLMLKERGEPAELNAAPVLDRARVNMALIGNNRSKNTGD